MEMWFLLVFSLSPSFDDDDDALGGVGLLEPWPRDQLGLGDLVRWKWEVVSKSGREASTCLKSGRELRCMMLDVVNAALPVLWMAEVMRGDNCRGRGAMVLVVMVLVA